MQFPALLSTADWCLQRHKSHLKGLLKCFIQNPDGYASVSARASETHHALRLPNLRNLKSPENRVVADRAKFFFFFYPAGGRSKYSRPTIHLFITDQH